MTIEDILALCRSQSGPCVSLFANLGPAEGNTNQSSLKVRNLVRQAEEQLDGQSQLLAPLRRLLEDQLFWQHQQPGFAAFVSEQGLQHFKLPVACADQVQVGSSFAIKPLLGLLWTSQPFYVLALSQHQVRLLECSLAGHHQLTLPDDVPKNIEEVRRFEDATGVDEGQMTVQRAQRLGGRSGPSGSTHGVGITNDALHEYRLRFLREVSSGLKQMLRQSSHPMVVVGVDELVHEFCKIFQDERVLAEHLSGNYDHASNSEIHARACPLAMTYFEKQRDTELARFTPALVEQLASSDLDQLLPAAHDGRIDTLFVAADTNLFGRYDTALRSIERLAPDHPEADDLLELLAVETLKQGGKVLALAGELLPEPESPVAAIFRY